jgi:hypothetical protein
MQVQKKPSHVSGTKTGEKSTSVKKSHDPREDEEVKASDSTVQPQIQRTDDNPDAMPRFGDEVVEGSGDDGKSELTSYYDHPVPREPDDPEPTPNPNILPIQRPDPGQHIRPRKPGLVRGMGR